MKKILFAFVIFSLCSFVFFACKNNLSPETDNTDSNVTTVTVENPEFYACDTLTSTTTIEKDKISNYFNKPANLPEDKTGLQVKAEVYYGNDYSEVLANDIELK